MKDKLFIICLVSNFLYGVSIDLNLNGAIELGLKNNLQNKISYTNLKIAQTKYAQAQSANYPVLDLGINATRRDSDIDFDMVGSIDIPKKLSQDLAFAEGFKIASSSGADFNNSVAAGNYAANSILSDTKLPMNTNVEVLGRNTVSSSLNLVYPLYTGGKISSIINQAKLNTKLKEKDIKIQENELIYNIKKIYFSYILSKKINKTMKDSYEKMKVIKDLTQQLYEGESLKVKKTDFLKSKIALNLMKAKLDSFDSNVILAKNALKNLLALPLSSDLNILDEDFPKEYLTKLMNKDDISNKDLSKNLDLDKLAIAIKIAQEKVKESKSSYFPTISLFANVSRYYNSMDSGLYSDDNKNSWTIGVNLKFNIFDGFKTKNEYEQYTLEKKKLLETQELLTQALKLQIKNEFVKSDKIYNSIENYKKALDTTVEHRDLNIRAYQIEMVDTKDMIESQILQTRTEIMYLNAEYHYLMSIANIDRLLTNINYGMSR